MPITKINKKTKKCLRKLSKSFQKGKRKNATVKISLKMKNKGINVKSKKAPYYN